jgi:hypothetical protein
VAGTPCLLGDIASGVTETISIGYARLRKRAASVYVVLGDLFRRHSSGAAFTRTNRGSDDGGRHGFEHEGFEAEESRRLTSHDRVRKFGQVLIRS